MAKGAAAARRAVRAAQYAEMKKESLVDAGIVGLAGAVIAFLASGLEAAEGVVLGAALGTTYLTLLYRDVDAVGAREGVAPLQPLSAGRAVRLLLPLVLVVVLSAQAALTAGLDEWLAGLGWLPGANFVGLVPSPATLYGTLLGYILPTLALQVKGLARAVPEVSDLVSALPGSVGVAVKFKQEAERRQDAGKAAAEGATAAEPVPVLLVSGPRGCGKSTLVSQLRKLDPRFQEPEWIATADSNTMGSGSKRRVVSEAEFEEVKEAGNLAVNYRPYSDEGEQVDLGLPATAVLDAAMAGGACILDVDMPTARSILNYRWEAALAAAAPDRKLELRVVSVWVSLSSLDAVVERNRVRLQDALKSSSVVTRQLVSLRSQATSDIEWAITSGSFDFTIINEDLEAAVAEMCRAARYCFADP